MSGAESPDLDGLYRQHRARLVRLVERELHHRQDAEDVVQTAFLDAQRALKRGTIPQNPPAWLAAIALNAARRLWGRKVNVQALEEYATQEASRLPEIKAALADLSKNEQAAVLYRDLLGLSYAETAEQMGTTVPAVTMLLHRARSRLRGILGCALVGVSLSRWARAEGWQATAAKAAGVVALAGGLGAAGVVGGGYAARSTAPRTAITAPTATRVDAAHRSNIAPTPSRAHRIQPRSAATRIVTKPNSNRGALISVSAAALPGATSPPVLPEAPVAVAEGATTAQPKLSIPPPATSVTSPSLPEIDTPPVPTTIAAITIPAGTTTLQTPAASATVSVPVATVSIP